MRLVETISKIQIALKDKARTDEKVEHTQEYVSPPEADKHFEEVRNAVIER